MRHYLTVKTGEIPKVRAVYEAFKRHARTPAVSGAGVEALVEDIRALLVTTHDGTRLRER